MPSVARTQPIMRAPPGRAPTGPQPHECQREEQEDGRLAAEQIAEHRVVAHHPGDHPVEGRHHQGHRRGRSHRAGVAPDAARRRAARRPRPPAPSP